MCNASAPVTAAGQPGRALALDLRHRVSGDRVKQKTVKITASADTGWQEFVHCIQLALDIWNRHEAETCEAMSLCIHVLLTLF